MLSFNMSAQYHWQRKEGVTAHVKAESILSVLLRSFDFVEASCQGED